MFTPVKNKKRLSTFALLGLFMIFSMLVTSTVEAQTLGDEQITETLAIASPYFEDTVGDGLPLITEEASPTPGDDTEVPGGDETPMDTPTGETTGEPTEDPTSDETQDQTGTQDGKETEEPTETQAPEETGTSTPEETVTDEPEETEPVEEDDPSETSEPTEEGSETPTPEPQETEATETEESETPEGTEEPTEEPELGLLMAGTESADRGMFDPDIKVSISATGNECGPDMVLQVSVKNESWMLMAWNVKVTVSIITGSNFVANPNFPITLNLGDISAGNTESDTINLTTNAAWEDASHNSQIQFKANIDQPTPKHSNHRQATVTIKKPNNCTSNTCPQGGDWEKIDGINALSYEYTAPSGYLVDQVCYKAGTTKITYDVNPDASPHTVTSTVLNPQDNNYQDISHASFKLVQEPKQPITLDWDCVTEGEHAGKTIWTIHNPNNMIVYFDWQSDMDDQSDSGSVAAGSDAAFYTNGKVQTVTVTYYYADGQARCGDGRCFSPVKYEIDATSLECKIALDLTITVDCLENGDHQWTVTNPNSDSITFDWVSSNGDDSGTKTVAGNGGTIQFSSNYKAQTVTLTYDYGAATGLSSSASTTEVCWVPQPLTIGVSCLPNGDHQWTVTNPNPVDIVFDWVSDNSVDSGQDLTVTMNGGTKQFTSNHEAQEVTVTYDYAGVTGRQVNQATQEVCWVPQDLIVSVECLDNGDHRWTVQNPNPHAISFAWYTNESPTPLQSGGPIKVPAKANGVYGNVSFTTDHTMHTVNISYDYTQASIFNKIVSKETTEVCALHLQIEPVCSFPGADNLVWKVINNNSYDVSYSYVRNLNYLNPVTGLVAHPGVSYIETDKWVSIIEIFEGYNKVDSARPTDPCYMDLTLDYECLDNGDHEWTVTNPNDNQSVSYHWKVNNGTYSNWIPLGALGEDQFIVPGTSAHTVKIEFKIELAGGVALKDSYTKLAGICIVLEPPEVIGQCAIVNGVMKHKWTVQNPNNYWIWYKWSSSTGEKEEDYQLLFGDNECNECDSAIFYTDHTDQTLTIYYKKHGFSEEHFFTVEADNCISAPTLTASCSLTNDSHIWTVDNTSNPVPLDFSWTSNASPAGGSDTVAANSTQPFTTNENGAQQSVTLTYTYQGESITLNPVTDDACDVVDMDISITGVDESCDNFSFQIKITNTADYLTAHGVNLDAVFDQDDLTDYVDTYSLVHTYPTNEWDIPAGESRYVTLSITTRDSTWKAAPANTSIDFTLSADSDETDVVTKTGSAVTPGSCSVNPTLEYGCREFDNSHIWTVENSNPFTIEIQWKVQDGVYNGTWLTILSGETIELDPTTSAPQAIVVKYKYGSEAEIEMAPSQIAEECKLSGLELNFVCGYPTDEALYWEVNNPFDFTVEFTWEVEGSDPLETGSETIGALGSLNFNTSLGDKTVVLYVNGNEVDQAESGEACYSDLELDFKCLITGLYEWTVTNNNDFAQTFDWSSTTGEGGTESVKANDSIEFTTGIETQTMTVSYQHDIFTKEAELIGESCKSPELDLVYDCGYPTDSVLYWYVSNPLDVDIDFSWEVVGSTEKGSGTASANDDTYFTTSTGLKSVKILVEGYEIDREDGGESCLVELSLTYNCLDNGTQQWTVTNLNKDAQTFSWSSDNGASGSGTAPAGGSYKFTTANMDQEITIEYKHDPFPAQSAVAHGEVCKISTPEPPTYGYGVSDLGTCQQWIIFHSMRDGNMEVYRLDGIEGVGDFKLYNLSKGDGIDSRPSRSFNDAWVAFQSNRDGNYEIYYGDTAGSKQIRLTDNEANDINPMFSPDNVHIVFQSDRNGNWDLYRVNRVTGVETQLTDAESDETNPFFSKNPNFLVFESDKNGNQDIFLLNIVTGDEYKVVTSEVDEMSPALSPNGQKIAYLSPVDGVLQLFVIGIDGTNKVQITDGDSNTNFHAWSPDSTRLAYQSVRDGNTDIYSYDLRDNTEYRVTENEVEDIGPTWDCGGVNLSFTSTSPSGDLNIYRVYWKGGTSSQMTIDPAADQWSEWSPAKETASRGD